MYPLDHDDTYQLRLATEDDAPAISELLEAAKREDIPLEERRRLGYVQGDMSLPAIRRRFETGFGALVAVDKSSRQVVGVNFFSDAPTDTGVQHPLAGVAKTIAGLQAQNATDASGTPISFDSSMMYGPLAVADSAGGHGLAKALILGMKNIAAERGQARIISFVDQANSVSMGMHAHIGLTRLADYDFGPGSYTIFAASVN